MRDNENQMVLKNSTHRGHGSPEVREAASLRHELHVNTAHTAVKSPSTGVRPTGFEFQYPTYWLPQP